MKIVKNTLTVDNNLIVIEIMLLSKTNFLESENMGIEHLEMQTNVDI